MIDCEKAKFNIAGTIREMIFLIFQMIEKDESIVQFLQFTLKEVIRQTIFSIADNDSN